MTVLCECRTHGLGDHPVVLNQQYAHARTVADQAWVLTRLPTEFMPDRSFEKFVRNPDSDAVLLPPIELTRFAKLCCSESTEPALLEVPALAPVVLLAAAVE